MIFPLDAAAAPSAAQPSSPLNEFAREVVRFVGGLQHLTAEELLANAGATSVILLFMFAAMWLVRRAVKTVRDRFLARAGEGRAARRRGVGGLTVALIDIGIFIFALTLILRAWGVNPRLFAGTATGEAISALIHAALIVVLATGAIEAARFVISHALKNAAVRTGDIRRAAQLRTLSPLLLGIVQTLILILAAMTVLSQIGVEIAPLLTGAGIVGIAIGFGAQTLVKDFFTGAFLLIEDIVSLGDNVEINGFTGRVEEMTLRTIRLRDFDGTLHVFPYGEAQVIHNRSKTYAYFPFDLQISYFSDIDKALEVIERTCEALRQDEKFKTLILEHADIVGVDKLSDNGVMLKGRIKVIPGEQWRVGREFQKRVKRDLDAAGVLISHRHLPVPPFASIAEKAGGVVAPSVSKEDGEAPETSEEAPPEDPRD